MTALSKSLARGYLAAVALISGFATAAGLYSEPYALFEPESLKITEDRARALVMSIDGKTRSVNQNLPVAPGKRTVVVSVPGRRGMSDPGRTTLEVDAKPCTRYYFAAKRSSRTASDWEGYLSGSDPIAECVKKFKDAK